MMENRELDLHGHTWGEARNAFLHFYNDKVSQGDLNQVEIVHGYGSTGEGGTVKKRLQKLLERHADYLEFISGEEWDGNPGHTLVSPKLLLPKLEDVLMEDIVQYCDIPRTQKKIIGHFVKRADSPTITSMIKQLEKQDRVRKITKNHQPMWEAP